jgi:hypothetical protein
VSAALGQVSQAFAAPEEEEVEGEKEFDPLRDGPLRFLGYANECGYVLRFIQVLQGPADTQGSFRTVGHERSASSHCITAFFQGGLRCLAISRGSPPVVCDSHRDKAYKAYSQTGQKLAADTELSPLVDQAKWAALHPAIPKTGCAKGKSAMKAVTLDSARGWLPRVTHLLLLQSPTWCLCAG